ncbi:lactate utilization protein B/C [Flavobacterium cheongpyeongense]|jgi:L-lactate dehydrogenase complex protein LldG|uniref:Lactate utilization protein B/C n=1 Tax=Flavobacterium cheongpyeongense TaxID=2212651 RepID=A0A2V4BT49_9FLAO|nr:LUD domain-containing protein [Flavobacterium cheongpyeongense]PXY42215.1 lactate utilization protein B/C [Flavobacterium cheongpyeongense]
MNSKAEILKKIKQNQPQNTTDLPDLELLNSDNPNVLETYKTVLKGIGGETVEVAGYQDILDFIRNNYSPDRRIITTIPELSEVASLNWKNDDPHTLQDVELAIISGHFGVAENSAIWVTDDILGQRVAPFIAQYLAIIIKKSDILATMQLAYKKIGNLEYGFGTFIAGPSKTADIEQSLVLGAHGARGLIVFLLD